MFNRRIQLFADFHLVKTVNQRRFLHTGIFFAFLVAAGHIKHLLDIGIKIIPDISLVRLKKRIDLIQKNLAFPRGFFPVMPVFKINFLFQQLINILLPRPQIVKLLKLIADIFGNPFRLGGAQLPRLIFFFNCKFKHLFILFPNRPVIFGAIGNRVENMT